MDGERNEVCIYGRKKEMARKRRKKERKSPAALG